MLTTKLKDLVQLYSQKHLLVIGDVMLDEYIWGTVDRISPEAPVPVVTVSKREYHSGGAANVARNLHGLGANVTLVGLTGDDAAGKTLLNILDKDNGIHFLPIEDNQRVTTVKTRVIAHDQHVVRLDDEKITNPTENALDKMKSLINNTINQVDGIILQDYNKGVLNQDCIEWVMALSTEKNIPVYVDPKKQNFTSFKGARFFKPNLNEFSPELSENSSINDAGSLFREKNKFDIVMVTQGKDGMTVFTENDTLQIPTKARAVHDVSGAGDTVIATFALNDLCGVPVQEAATIANLAAGRVCEEVGVVPITSDKLVDFINNQNLV